MVTFEMEELTKDKRDLLMGQLKAKGIDSRPYFYPISDMPMYEKAVTPVTHKIYKRGINLPSYFDLDNSKIEYICKTVLSLTKNIQSSNR